MIKICGLTAPYEAEYLNEYNIEFAGMVLFFPKSKRNVNIERAREIMSALSPEIKRVAVTVSPTAEQVRQIGAAGFDIIQIHGDLADDAVDAADIPIWRAFNERAELDRYRGIKKITGYVFDAPSPGSGQTFDWNILKNISADGRLLILAGGLNPQNVGEAVRLIAPDVVDVSTGVENDSGMGKNKEKIALFAENARKNVTI